MSTHDVFFYGGLLKLNPELSTDNHSKKVLDKHNIPCHAYLIYTRWAMHKKDPCAIYRQHRPWSACANAQADLGLCCPLTESADAVVHVDEQKMPRLDWSEPTLSTKCIRSFSYIVLYLVLGQTGLSKEWNQIRCSQCIIWSVSILFATNLAIFSTTGTKMNLFKL